MSRNVQRVIRDIENDMRNLPYVSADAWAEILLKHSRYCETEEDQQDFWKYILNPTGCREFKDPEFYTVPATDNVDINTGYKVDDQFYTSDLRLEGGTMFVTSKPYVANQDDEKCDEKIYN